MESKYKTGRSIKQVEERISLLKEVYEQARKDLHKLNDMFVNLNIESCACLDYDEDILLKIVECINNNRIELCYLRGD